MDAYTLVDQATRRNMEAIVKTWKEPVPGSMDPRPVFPPDVVKPIENALIKAKTVTLQSGRPAQMQVGGYRNTPTPPQYNARYAAPPGPGPAQSQPYQSYPNHQVTPRSALRESPDLPTNRFQTQPYPPHPSHSPFPPTPQQYQQHVYAPPPQQQPVSDVEGIKRDVTALIAERQAQSGREPHNQDLKTQLQALQQLQTILNTQTLDPGSLQAVQRQISSLAAQAPSTPRPAPQQSWQPNQQWRPQAPTPQPQYPANPYSLPYHQPPSAQPQPQAPAAPPALPPGALNGLQALLANGQKPSTPQMRAAAPSLQNASHQQLNNIQSHAASTPAINGGDLLASLSKSGLLPKPPSAQPTPPAPTPSAVPAPGPQSTADLLKSLSGLLPASQTGTPTLPTAQLANTGKPRIPMTAAALKTFRPELVHSLYDAYPNQCSTCGRRFPATPTGREKKDRHLDWHFRTNQRMADPNTNRGQHRNWYIPELDWIKLSEFDPSTTTAAESAANAAEAAKKEKKKKSGPEDKFVRAPPGTTKATCSICFEEMKTSYSEELQDWIFPAATTYGGKIVHAQCLAEMLKGQQGGALGTALGGGGGQRQRSATPDSSLGKRMAESALAGAGARVRMQ